MSHNQIKEKHILILKMSLLGSTMILINWWRFCWKKRKATLELLPFVVWVVWERPLLPKWFISTPKSSSTSMAAALGYLSHNNVKKDLFGKKLWLTFSLNLKRIKLKSGMIQSLSRNFVKCCKTKVFGCSRWYLENWGLEHFMPSLPNERY